MMVDYLARTEVVVPSVLRKPGRGRRRLYSFGDLVVLRAVGRLLESGISVARLKTALKTLQRNFRHLRPEGTLCRYLITDGRNVYLEEESGALTDLTDAGQMAFAFVVDIRGARDDVIKATVTA
jgi:DNA-binding transcriptional MerR regulator